MAGRGSRLRPHTLTVPKPLIPIAGKPIVQRLVEDIVSVCDQSVEEIAFVVGDIGEEVEEKVEQIIKRGRPWILQEDLTEIQKML